MVGIGVWEQWISNGYTVGNALICAATHHNALICAAAPSNFTAFIGI